MYLDNECVRLFEECFLMNFSLLIMYSTLILIYGVVIGTGTHYDYVI